MIEQIISLIAPHYCLGCDFGGELLCVDCRTRMTKVPPRCYRCNGASDDFRTCRPCKSSSKLFQVWNTVVYEGAAKTLVGKLKFERAKTAAKIMADQMTQQLPADSDWLVTHIPTATSRVRQRGYDQAQLIAKRLSRQNDYLYTPLLARTGQRRQVGQKAVTRREQMASAFRPIRQSKIAGRHILLVDDVLTTGATLEAAAATLKAAGAKRVSAAVFAAA